MKVKEYYTLEEMHKYLDNLDNHRTEVRKESPLKRDSFEIFGFKCVYNFCETSFGWVPSYEECCEYCVHSIISSSGSRDDRIKFNKMSTLSVNYTLPITNKEVALHNKKKRINKNNEVKRKSRNKLKLKRARGQLNIYVPSSTTQNETLRELRRVGIPILRRTKRTLYDDIFRHNNTPEDFVYIKGLKAVNFMVHIPKDELYLENLLIEINNEIERQGARSESNVALLSMYELKRKININN